jgi:hydroxyacylglutathione hydrolase
VSQTGLLEQRPASGSSKAPLGWLILLGTVVVAALGTEPAALAAGTAVVSYPRADWEETRRRGAQDVVLDVRRTDEYDAGHLAGAVNIPLHELLSRMDEVPAGKVWVHCESGYRSGVAASLLQRAGRDVMHVDARFRDAASS